MRHSRGVPQGPQLLSAGRLADHRCHARAGYFSSTSALLGQTLPLGEGGLAVDTFLRLVSDAPFQEAAQPLHLGQVHRVLRLQLTANVPARRSSYGQRGESADGN
eukprot:654482-Prorocentrum_minimum.AAC.2